MSEYETQKTELDLLCKRMLSIQKKRKLPAELIQKLNMESISDDEHQR